MTRRRFTRNRVSARKGNLVWITNVIEASILEIAGLDIGDLVVPSDWEGQGFDRCTLMGIRGWLGAAQAAAATAADACGLYLAIYVTDQQSGAMAPGIATDYTTYDVLWTAGSAASPTGATAQPAQYGQQVEVKARRRLTSAQEVRMVAGLTTDTATPRYKINGVIRALLKTD